MVAKNLGGFRMSKSNHFNFTKAVLTALPLPEKGKTGYYYDEKSRGLGLYVTASGTRTFFVYRKIEGKPERIKLGRFPDMSIEQARKQAGITNSNIDMGENPQEEKRKKRQEITFGEFFEIYMQDYAKDNKKTWNQDKHYYDSTLTHLKDRKITSISKNDIKQIQKDCGEKRGKHLANRVLALVRSMYNKAEDLIGVKVDNPAAGIKFFPEVSRERFLKQEEFAKFFCALNEYQNETLKDYIYISLYTGARKTNVLEMRWDQVSFASKEWRIPETKNGTSQTIPLVDPAIDILRRRKSQNKGPWVFPGDGKTGHLVEPKKGWRSILTSAGIKDLRLHDLRRTLGSWQAISGTPLHIISKTLNHKTAQATNIYARLTLDPVRASMEKATQLMQSFGDNKGDDESEAESISSND
jgi:integrase